LVEYDVIVVGGGPAGSTAARSVALAGLNVLLIDKANFPRYKPCAGAIRNSVTKILDIDLNDTLQRKISGFSIFAPTGFRIDCIPEDRSYPGYTVMRKEFDQLLLRKAEERGVVVEEGKSVVEAVQDNRGVKVMTQDNETFTSKFLVGADGINSVVAKTIGFYNRWPSDSAMVSIEIEAEVGKDKVREICGEPSGYDADLFFLYFGDFPHGYTWCFPKRSILSLGACCRQDKVENLRVVYDQWYSRFKSTYDIEPKIVSDTSARFPVKVKDTFMKGRTILVGDAAGFVDAFTGEGIPHAINSGLIAGTVIGKAAKQDEPKLLKEYVTRCKKEIINVLGVSDYFANLFYKSEKNMDIICRFLRDDEYGNYLIAALIGGLLPAKTVKRKMMFRMMRKRPMDALSLLR
jgi:geranylgeranyl reductase family protein